MGYLVMVICELLQVGWKLLHNVTLYRNSGTEGVAEHGDGHVVTDMQHSYSGEVTGRVGYNQAGRNTGQA